MVEDILSKKIVEDQTLKLQQEMDSIYDSLVVNAPHNMLPENIFREHFLPFFSVSAEEGIGSDNAVLSQWISIAGTPNNEVDVVDGAGQVLFTVPSLFDTSVIETVQRDVGNSLADITHTFELKNNNIPIVAENYLNNQLTKKLGIVKPSTNREEVEKRWGSIFARYGIEKTTTQSTAKEDDGLADDIIY